MSRYDAVVIGAGPAGMAAAVNLKIREKRFLLFGSQRMSRKLTAAPRVDNYLGFYGVTGAELGQRFAGHLEAMDIAAVEERIQMIYPMGGYFSIASSSETYEASAVILATGAFSAAPIKGEEQFLGRGVGYCATCDAPLYRGKTVAVLGYNDEAAREADFIAGIAAKTYYVPMKKTAVMPGAAVEVLAGRAVGVEGDSIVRALLMDSGKLETDGVFILRDSVAPASLLPGLAIEGSFIAVDSGMATSIAGCYAAGDCTGKPHQYMRAVGQGQTAALAAVEYLDTSAKA